MLDVLVGGLLTLVGAVGGQLYASRREDRGERARAEEARSERRRVSIEEALRSSSGLFAAAVAASTLADKQVALSLAPAMARAQDAAASFGTRPDAQCQRMYGALAAALGEALRASDV
jgi:hypothetical protein